MEKKIGLFGGTFDPVHHGHLNLAFELMEKKGLNEVWFIPAQVNPLKINSQPVAAEHRLAMLQLALDGIECFKIKTLELKRPPPSFTIDTVETFVAEEALNQNPAQFFLLIGEDSLNQLPHWKSIETIIKLSPLLVGSRVGELSEEFMNCSEPIWQAFQKGLTVTQLFDISSSTIRERLKKGLSCRHLLYPSVEAYIFQHQLYVN